MSDKKRVGVGVISKDKCERKEGSGWYRVVEVLREELHEGL
jgi:hypothetical protein